MGNKATTTTKNGKKKRTARRTSVLLQQLTDKEYRQGQLNIKEHEYSLIWYTAVLIGGVW